MNIIKSYLKWNGELQDRTSTDFFIFHHAESSDCSILDVHRWHKELGWVGIGYNFFITKEGKVYEGRPIEKTDADAYGYNDNSISCCFEGDFNIDKMTDAQVKSGIELLRYCKKLYPNIRALRHKDVNDTLCPGQYFRNEIIYNGMVDIPETVEKHWAEDSFQEILNSNIVVNERRFDDTLRRGEFFVVIAQLLKKIK